MDTETEKELNPTEALAQDLRALAGAALLVPKSVDDAVLAMAQRRMKRHRRVRVATAAAAAAGILLAAGAVWMLSAKPSSPPAPLAVDVNGDGRVDILDALALARKIESRAALDPNRSLAHKGAADGKDVDAMIRKIVRVSGAPVVNKDQHAAYRTIDIYIDSGQEPLAAYQIEINDPTGCTKIVGVEGGEPATFMAPPYYDASALGSGHIILASLSTGGDLPSGKVRVARLRVAFSGAGGPTCLLKVCAAGTADGNRIPPRFYIAQGGAELNRRNPADAGAGDGEIVLAPPPAIRKFAVLNGDTFVQRLSRQSMRPAPWTESLCGGWPVNL